MQTGPIKRSNYIVPLSREHHSTLLFSWKIRQGLKNNVDPLRIVAYVRYFWQEHMQDHFKKEENFLFSKIKDEYTMKAVNDHEQISYLVQRILLTVSTQTLLAELAEMVDDHVRFEERVLFPHLEQAIPEVMLQNIAGELGDQPEKQDEYEDVFWKN